MPVQANKKRAACRHRLWQGREICGLPGTGVIAAVHRVGQGGPVPVWSRATKSRRDERVCAAECPRCAASSVGLWRIRRALRPSGTTTPGRIGNGRRGPSFSGLRDVIGLLSSSKTCEALKRHVNEPPALSRLDEPDPIAGRYGSSPAHSLRGHIRHGNIVREFGQ